MHYVYLLESQNHPGQRYIGSTNDLKKRLNDHNAGYSPHTAKFFPWILRTYIAFDSKEKAEEFETYLKHGSGHAFAKRHFW
jgi:putative endonuclease